MAEQAPMCHPVLYSDWGILTRLSMKHAEASGPVSAWQLYKNLIQGLSQWVAVSREAHAQNLRNDGVLLSNYRLSFMSQLKRLQNIAIFDRNATFIL